jgi:hypothetical protein
MSRGSIRTTIAALALLCLALAARPGAQVEYTNNFKYNSGQGIQPIFEGWSHAPDGSINMHFGYLNRNYVEMPHIPIGPNNNVDPGGPDRGQPTFFYTRTNRNLFTVNVPKDWPINRDVVWTLTVNDKTEKAFGWLRVEWEIDPAGGAGGGGGSQSPERKQNQPPSVAVDPIANVKLPESSKIVATITDDGLPKPRPGGARRGQPVGQETPPTLRGGVEAPVNVPQIARGGRGGDTPPGATAPAGGGAAGGGGGGAAAGGGGRGQQDRPQGPTVSLIVGRGPADVTFGRAEVEGDKRIVNATFTKPGEYTLRAVANDTLETSAPQFVKVVVQ